SPFTETQILLGLEDAGEVRENRLRHHLRRAGMFNFFRLALAFLVIAMAGLVSAVVTMRFAIHGAEVKVPDLQGLTVSEAVHRTANLGLNLGIDNKYY